MKIYQIHEHGGDYEDEYDFIRSTYLDKDQAEEEKVKLEIFEEQRYREALECMRCPGYENCQRYVPNTNVFPYTICKEYDGNLERCYFSVETVEVIE